MLYHCQLCLQPTHQAYVCRPCYQDLPATPEATEYIVKQQNPSLDHIFCPYLYQPPVSQLIQQLKYHKRYSHSRLLAYLFYQKLKETYRVDKKQTSTNQKPILELPEYIVPVPLHNKKLRSKGFNQSFELAKFICKMLKCTNLLNYKICQRRINTPSQTGLHKKERRKNMHHAFAVNQILNCKHIILVDDVLTTGSTASSLAETLKAAGVQRVDLWTIAFAELN